MREAIVYVLYPYITSALYLAFDITAALGNPVVPDV